MPQTQAPHGQPSNTAPSVPSRRAQQPHEFIEDQAGEAAISKIMTIVIGFIFINLVAVLLFTQVGIDSTSICNDTGNFSTEDCASATAQRNWFWTILVIVNVVILLVLLGVAKSAAKF